MRIKSALTALCVAGTALLLAACAVLLEHDAVKLCRSLIPAFNAGEAKLELQRTDATRTVHGTLITIAYTAKLSQRLPEARGSVEPPSLRRGLSCIIQRDPANPARLTLTNLATEDGPLGEVRLHLLRRQWIESGQAAISDPAPIALVGPMPELPRAAAMALQLSLASLPSLSIYALLAAAYALIYGLIGRINLAFGELAMLAGYGAFLGFSMFATQPGLAMAVLAAVLVGLFTALTQGALLGRLVLAPLVARPGQHILIATVGLSIFWAELVRLTQGSGNRWLPPFLAKTLGIARGTDAADTSAYVVTLTPMTVLLPVLATVALGAALTLMQQSRFGRAWRATADDPVASALFGIDPKAVLMKTMLLASALAGLGGILTTLHYGSVGASGGLVVGLKALIAAVIGGIGSVRGAIGGALVLGLAEAVWSGLFRIEYRDPAIFAALAALLILKPEGLFNPPTSLDETRRAA